MSEFFSFSGKSNRKEFIAVTILNLFIINMSSIVLSRYISGKDLHVIFLNTFIISALFFALQLPVTVRRLKDLEKSRSMVLILVTPVNIFFLIYLAFASAPGFANQMKTQTETATEEEVQVVLCPACNSSDCDYDKNAYMMNRIMFKVSFGKSPVIKEYRCFECGNRWELQ